MQTHTHASDARIVAEKLSFAHADGRLLFNDLTLSFGRERTGLVGPNGSGKTTLLRLLAGELQPGSGCVYRPGLISVLPQDFRPLASAPLSAILGIDTRLETLARVQSGAGTVDDLEAIGDDWDLPERAQLAIATFGLEHLRLDQPVGLLSGGEATRVALAALTLGRSDFLLLDEPTNNLDRDGREELYDFVEGWRGGIVCVSHDRELLRRMDRVVELTAGGARTYGGNYDDYRAQKDAEQAAAEDELSNARSALRKAERAAREQIERQARRQATGRREGRTANMPRILLGARKNQAQATTARIRSITERAIGERRDRVREARERVEERERPRFGIPSSNLPAGRLVLELFNVAVRFEGCPEPLLEGVSLRMVGPDRVGITGPNGSGKSSLLRLVLGEAAPAAGEVRRLPAEEIGFMDQKGALLKGKLTVLENFRERHPDMDLTAARYALARFLFKDDEALRPVDELSGGQRLRASLAMVLGGQRSPSLIVLDEPTNHLDLDAIEALEDALREYDGALLVVSHDSDFLESIGVERYLELGG